jgi:uncharacterized protein
LKKPSEIQIEVAGHGKTTAIIYPAERTAPVRKDTTPSVSDSALILGHGAGAGQRSPFMIAFARALASHGLDVVTFNFLYTEQKRRAPDKAPLLEACYAAAIDAVRDGVESARHSLFIGGKSMGGRIATQVAAARKGAGLAGLILLGYPLHPPGRPEQRRDAHLPSVGRPMFFIQGSRDAFGTPQELAPVLQAIGATATIHVVEGGDHSFKTPRGDQTAVYEDVQRAIVDWIGRVTGTSAPAPRRSA